METPKPLPTSDRPSTEEEYNERLPNPPAEASWAGRIARLFLVLVILGTSATIAAYWLINRPKAKPHRPKPEATLVEVTPVQLTTERVFVPAMGTVVPAMETQLAARVGGQIVEVSPQFRPGDHFAESEMMLQIERADYELAVKQREADLTRAESSLKLEMGQQSVAQREYEILGESAPDEDEQLLLRQPQLEATKAAIAAAKASLEKARLDLARTSIKAPFNAVVQSRNVDLGSYIAPGTPLATLVGTDEYWIEVSVPVDELQWIHIPGLEGNTGSNARVSHEAAWGRDAYRVGSVSRLMTEIEPGGLMAQLLVSVPDPLQLAEASDGALAMILGAHVDVQIEGKDLTNVVKVADTALRDGSQVWVMNPDRTLEIRNASVAWSSNDHVYISEGLEEGDLLITSGLAAPFQGMALRTAEEAEESDDEAQAGAQKPRAAENRP